MGAGDLAFDDLVVAYLTAGHEQPDMARLLVWDGLTSTRSAPAEPDEPPEIADVRRLTGLDPASPEFLDRYGDHLRRLIRRLRPA